MISDPSKYSLTDESIQQYKNHKRYLDLVVAREAVRWKELWDEVLNDKKFREEFTRGTEVTLGLNDIGKKTYVSGDIPKLKSVGTIHLEWSVNGKRQDEDHFVGYTIINNSLIIFDPARSGQRYGEFMKKVVVDYIQKHAKMPVILLEMSTQCSPGDTFCQTWSVTWARHQDELYVTPETVAHVLMAIIYDIADTKEFKNASARILKFKDPTFKKFENKNAFIRFRPSLKHIEEILRG
jgi:hypothetical protein